MKAVGISMVRNEADVIESFVRHHAAILDELVIVDHRSVDGTGEILRQLAEEGLPISLRTEQSLVQRQNAVLTSLMHEAAEQGADWVLPLDADEFLVSLDGDVRSVLEGLPPEPHTAEVRLYVPAAGDPENEPCVLRRIRRRRPVPSHVWLQKAVIPGSAAANSRMTLPQGSHGLIDEDAPVVLTEDGFVEFAASTPAPLALAHFPVRSAGQIARKALGGWPAHLARPDRINGEAWHWERVFRTVVVEGELDRAEVEALALDYYGLGDPGGPADLVLEPVPAPFELRYRPAGEPTPLAVLAATAEALAEELGAALQDQTAGEPVSA